MAPQGCVVLEVFARRESLSSPVQSSEAAYAPWLMVPSSIFSANHIASSFFSDLSSILTSLPLWLSYLPVVRTLTITWGHLGNPGALPHLTILNLATLASSLLAGKVSYSQIFYLQVWGQDVDIFEGPFFSLLNLPKG